jgi:hypothetical protein
MRVKVTAFIDAEDDEVDPTDSTGLTGEAYDRFMEGLMALGLDDINIEKAES